MQRLDRIGFRGPVMPEPFSATLNELAASDPLAAARKLGASLDLLWSRSGLA
jgi:predicted xylose isomerase-like sugar epimerase